MKTTPSIAIRFYRGLLRLLPFDFRSDFGPEMEEVFREQSADAQRSGAKGAFRLWWETVSGIFRTAPREHLAMFSQDAGFALRMMRKIRVHARGGVNAGVGYRRQFRDF